MALPRSGWSKRDPPITVPQKVQLGLQVAPSRREPGGRQWFCMLLLFSCSRACIYTVVLKHLAYE